MKKDLKLTFSRRTTSKIFLNDLKFPKVPSVRIQLLQDFIFFRKYSHYTQIFMVFNLEVELLVFWSFGKVYFQPLEFWKNFTNVSCVRAGPRFFAFYIVMNSFSHDTFVKF